jgi:two-component system CheB/CheR fusion protein
MARQTLRAAKSNEEFVQLFEGRLEALAAAHNLLVEGRWEGTEFGAIARRQLAAYMSDDPMRLQLDGEPVILPPDLATPFGLVLHELATNAAKYGAFSTTAGRVRLSWKQDRKAGRAILRVVWREEGGPPVSAPVKVGFGGSLIERGLPGADVRRDFLPQGLTCTIEAELPRGEENESAD